MCKILPLMPVLFFNDPVTWSNKPSVVKYDLEKLTFALFRVAIHACGLVA